MTYRELQKTLKEFKNRGLTNIKLNSKKTVLEKELNRLESIPVKQRQTTEKEIALYRKELAKYFNLNFLHEAKVYNRLCEMVEKDVNNGEELNLKLVDSYHAPEDYKFIFHDAYMDYKALKQS